VVVLGGGLSLLTPLRAALLTGAGLDPSAPTAPGGAVIEPDHHTRLVAPALGAALVAAGQVTPGDRCPLGLRMLVHRRIRDQVGLGSRAGSALQDVQGGLGVAPPLPLQLVPPVHERIVPLSPTPLHRSMAGQLTPNRLFVVALASLLKLAPFQDTIVPTKPTAMHRMTDAAKEQLTTRSWFPCGSEFSQTHLSLET